MEPKRTPPPKMEFFLTEEKIKKIVDIITLLPNITYTELRVLPDTEIDILWTTLNREHQRQQSILDEHSSNRFFGDPWATTDEVEYDNGVQEEGDETMPF